ncbi:major facilitator superfamily domain-containing protein [Gigaspora rosea]|uniref:Lysosomal dipeptide transporter MFSD1 n=1 Tax=Gigaspora rosea TaxID=44941 RepID=A0A397VF46_9GLOM|nr:major facilitator superfamily domain-containing protein [Gigaspora rosea]CAG8556251.1 15000_t:CDS:2 [Gigaspora rosea]
MAVEMGELDVSTVNKLKTLGGEESDEESDFLPSFTKPTRLPPSMSTLDVMNESADLLEDKEWLILNKRRLSTVSSLRDQSERFNDQSLGSRRGSFKLNNVDRIIKMCAMACACTFGIGSHFVSHIIGPMKGILMEQLNLTNTQFSLLVASFTLCNSVIPIVSGVLVAKFGTTRSSLVVTSIILIGTIIVTAACWTGRVGLMILGFTIFGSGLAPLTIVQETIIVQFFQGSGLGFALAAGMALGRLASFLATVLAVPLSMVPSFEYRMPFLVATFTCFLSWVMNIVYVCLLRHADNRNERTKEGAALYQVVENKTVHWNAIFTLSDIFWWLLVVGFLFGSCITPFLHLSSNIIKHRYDTTDLLGSWDASLIMLMPVIVYPFLGLFLDKYGHRLTILIFGSLAFLFTYLLLLTPPSIVHPLSPILLFAMAYSVVPLTMVTLIPLLTKHVSTGLGLYKSVDNIGATLCQTISGLLLDAHAEKKAYIIDENGVELGHEDDDLVALKMFAVLSLLSVVSCCIFWWADKKYRGGSLDSINSGTNHDLHENTNYGQLRETEEINSEGRILSMSMIDETARSKTAISNKKKRITIYMWIMGLMLAICWIVFGVVAYEKAGVHANAKLDDAAD